MGILDIFRRHKQEITIEIKNGKAKLIVNGKAVDPKSKEGKQILKETDVMKKVLSASFKKMDQMFDDIYGDL